MSRSQRAQRPVFVEFPTILPTKQARHRRLRFERLEARAMLSVNGDFNGDGFDDLAVGAAGENVSGFAFAGAVSVVYGSRRGLAAANNQFWHQDSPGVNGVAGASDAFGVALAAGDFNDDGFDDLAIGASQDDVNGDDFAGAVHVLFGSASGLRAGSVDQRWTQDSPGVNDSAEAGDLFGRALAAGDFNNDGRDDLAIGAIGESVGSVMNAGMVNVLYGSTSGLTGVNDQHWHQNSSGINDVAETNDNFGRSLGVGDFNHDGRDDLAVSTPSEESAGAVNVIYGSSSGLTSSGDQFWMQGSALVPEMPETNDRFGFALATGDFNNDNFDDLAIGIPGEDNNNGGVQILTGSATKLIVTSNFFNQSTLGFAVGANFEFGYSLASGDFDNDGFDDLAVGSPGETVGTQSDAGAVHAVYGSGAGLLGAGAINPQRWTQDTGNVQGASQTNDDFGISLATGDYDGDGRADLAIGVYGDVIGGVQAGAVNVLYSFFATGLFDLGNQLWHQGLLSSTDGNETEDLFGFSLG